MTGGRFRPLGYRHIAPGLAAILLVWPMAPPGAWAAQGLPGTLVSWGDQVIPLVPPGTIFKGIAGGTDHSLALRQDGTVAAWGHDSNWPFTYPSYWTGVVAIAASGDHWLALKQDGSVMGWYTFVGPEQPPAGLTGVVGIAAGAYHSLALKQNGTVVAWGAGQTIQPGTDNQGQSIVPDGLSDVIAIAAGGEQSLALKQDATLVAWGANDSGQSTLPAGLPWVLAVAASWSHTMALVDFSPPAPVVSVAPRTQTARVGTTVGFSVQADGPPPLSYQWYFGGTNGYFGGANALGGATNAALNFTSVGLSQSGPYWVVVTNLFGAVTSPGAVLTVLAPPSLVAGLTNLVAMPGTLVDFSVEVASAAPLSYQWFFNGTNLLAGANNSVLELFDVQIGQSGTYEVVVSNPFGAVTSSAAMLTVLTPVVTENTEAALRQALAGGGVVSFACDATITLTNQIVITNDTVLDGTGHQVTIACTNPTPTVPGSGNRAFYVSSNVTFTALNLAICNGCAQALDAADSPTVRGGAILNDGVLNLRGVSLLGSSARGGGGAVANRAPGTVNAANCTFAGNGAGSFYAIHNFAPSGGAILNEGGQVSLQACVFQGNSAQGGHDQYGDGPCDAYGGAIHNEGILNVSACTFQENSAAGSGGFTAYQHPGASGGPGGSAFGGAICNLGTLALTSSTILSNSASGGGGGRGNSGAAGGQFGEIGSGSGGHGGDGLSGGLFAGGTASAVNCTFFANTGAAGGGGQGGAAWTGVYTDPFGHTYQEGGPAGADGTGGYGDGSGCGGVALTNCTLAFNMAMAGTSGAQWMEEGLGVLGPNAVNTLVATTASGGTTSGPVIVAGHNLGSDAATLGLGSLADNGGPTLTMALLPGSPAIGAADSASAPPTDQRGFPRPAGSADIGAYEFGYPPILAAAQPPGGGVDISVSGRADQIFWLLTSPDLVNWTPVATNSFGPSGVFLFHDPTGAGQTQKFYRAVMP
ncbi:MAG: choice-of-anchor Q domain-containing protein [Verrucomicrobiota bacterium]